MNLTLCQRLRYQGVVVSLMPDGKTIEIYGPKDSLGGQKQRHTFFGLYGGGILRELLAERDVGRSIAAQALAEEPESCCHSWDMLLSPLGVQGVLVCSNCGAPA